MVDVRVDTPASPGSGAGWGRAFLFAGLCGLLAESFEVLRIQAGGIAPLGLGLRMALWVAYAAAALILYGMATLLGRRRALPVAAVGFALLLVLPWLNFAYLPRLGSLRSLLGTAAAVLLVAVLVPLVLRAPRALATAVLLLAVATSAWPLIAGRDAGRVAAPAGQAPPPFNIVIVLIDTLRADHTGTYGYARPTSPHFDAVAREGVVFDQTVAQAPWTKPSVASLMTGVFVHKHGVVSSRDALGGERPTLAEALRLRGYRTAAFSGNPWITPEFRFDRGFDSFESGRAMGAQLTNLYKVLKRGDRALKAVGLPANLSGWAFWGNSGNTGNSERDRLLTDAAVEWIEAQGDEDGSPFFLYVHLIGPHDPYDPPTEYVQRFRPANWDGIKGRTVPPARVQTVFDVAEPLAAPAQEALIAQYDGAIAYADEQLGRVVEALRRSGQLDRTLLVVTADHGEEFYEHKNWRHGNQLYNEVVHVPLTFRLPNRLQPERRADLAMLVDLFPTITGLVDPGQAALAEQDGRPLFAATAAQNPAAFSEHWWMEGGTYVSRMVRRGDVKLQETKDEARGQERSELYDLASDQQEQRNLLENGSTVSENGVGELQTLLARFGDTVSVASVSVDVDQSTKERLRQLGY